MGKTAVGDQSERLYPHRLQPNYCVLSRLREILEGMIARHLQPPTLQAHLPAVDIGCGSMPYRPLIEPYVQQYTGVDFPSNQLADIHFEAKTGKIPLGDQSAGIIVSTQVLEHVENPAAYLAEARRIVHPEGLLFLSTHGYWQEHSDPQDFWRWTSDGLAKLMHDADWKIIDMAGVLGFAASALQLFQQASAPKVPVRLHKPFFGLMQGLIALTDRFYTPAGRLRNAAVFVICAQPCLD